MVSGEGTNLQAILDACAEGRLHARVALVLSNRADAKALERARCAQVPAEVVVHSQYATRESFETRLIECLQAHGCEWIVLAGFMRLLTPQFLGAFPERILNIHPSLLPAFPGVHPVKQALDYGVKVTGCTVHLVDEGTDQGPIIAQRVVDVLEDDDEASLTRRMHAAEHELYVDTLNRIARGGLVLEPTATRRHRASPRLG